jgi:hypothetical protein
MLPITGTLGGGVYGGTYGGVYGVLDGGDRGELGGVAGGVYGVLDGGDRGIELGGDFGMDIPENNGPEGGDPIIEVGVLYGVSDGE